MRVRLTDDPDGAIYLESSYRDWSPVLGDFKSTIPYDGRRWDDTSKRWIIHALYLSELLTFLASHQAQIQDDRVPAQEAPRLPMPSELADAFQVLHLAPSAPLAVAEAAFRALSKFYHPDRGGDAADFNRVSSAIATIRTYLDPQEDPDDSIPF